MADAALAQALHLDPRAEGLLPYEIRDHVLQRTHDPYFTTSCSDEFLKDLRNFIDETIVQQAAKYRLEYGMPPALKPLHRGEKRNGRADSKLLPDASNL